MRIPGPLMQSCKLGLGSEENRYAGVGVLQNFIM